MKINRVKVQPYMNIGYCEECGGEMVPTGTVYLTYPASYEYKCSKCGAIVESDIELNKVYYREIEKDEEVSVP